MIYEDLLIDFLIFPLREVTVSRHSNKLSVQRKIYPNFKLLIERKPGLKNCSLQQDVKHAKT